MALKARALTDDLALLIPDKQFAIRIMVSFNSTETGNLANPLMRFRETTRVKISHVVPYNFACPRQDLENVSMCHDSNFILYGKKMMFLT